MTNYDVAIFTGWSAMGGSTESYINLTNALNKEGINAILVGPHDWHLNKCKGAMLSKEIDWKVKNVIWHFLPYMNKDKLFPDATHILSCHETELNQVYDKYKDPLQSGVFDFVHFVSDHQKEYQVLKADYDPTTEVAVIPNLLDPSLIKRIGKVKGKVGGVIGSIDRNKQTHVSIQKALDDGCACVWVFGSISDKAYYSDHVKSLFENPKVRYKGMVDDKNEVYKNLTDVYHYSLKESWGYIDAECKFLEINYHTSLENRVSPINNSEVLELWKEILE